MLRFLAGIFVILHGLVHLWYVTLSTRLVEYKPDMGWTGESWLLTSPLGDSATRALASGLYVLATLGFVAGGIGLLARQDWRQGVLAASAILSTAIIILFWDGNTSMLVQKGLIGVLINVGVMLALYALK